MIASHDSLTQVVNTRLGINSLVTGVHHVEVVDMYPNPIIDQSGTERISVILIDLLMRLQVVFMQ